MFSKCWRCGAELTTGDIDGLCIRCRNTPTVDERIATLEAQLAYKDKRIAELEKECATPILVNTARLAEQLADERAKVEKASAIAFIKGAKYWEYRQTKGTMWQSDQKEYAQEAMRRFGYEPTMDDLFPHEAFKKVVEALAAVEPKE